MKLGPWEKTVGRALKSLLALPQGDPIGFLRRRRRNNAKIDSILKRQLAGKPQLCALVGPLA